MCVVIHITADVAAKFIEAIIHRMEVEIVSEMPFANERGVIARLTQHLRQGQLILRDAPGPALFDIFFTLRLIHWRNLIIRNPRTTLLVTAGHQRSARRRTHRTVAVKVGEPYAAGREAVYLGRPDLTAAVATKRAVAQIIGEDENNVGFPARLSW